MASALEPDFSALRSSHENTARALIAAFRANFVVFGYVFLVYLFAQKFEVFEGMFDYLQFTTPLLPFFLAGSLNYYYFSRLAEDEDGDFLLEKGRAGMLRCPWPHYFVAHAPILMLVLWRFNGALFGRWHDTLGVDFLGSQWFGPTFCATAFFGTNFLLLLRANFIVHRWINPVKPMYTRLKLWRLSLYFLFWLFAVTWFMAKRFSGQPPGFWLFFAGIIYLLLVSVLHPLSPRWSLFKNNRRPRLKMVRWLDFTGSPPAFPRGGYAMPPLGTFEGPSLYLPILTTIGKVYPLAGGFLLETREQGQDSACFTLVADGATPTRLFSSLKPWHTFWPAEWDIRWYEGDMDGFFAAAEPYLQPPAIDVAAETWVERTRRDFLLRYAAWISQVGRAFATAAAEKKLAGSGGSPDDH